MEPIYISPSNNLHEIIAIGELVRKCVNLQSLQNLYLKHESYNHPSVHFDFGRGLAIMGDKITAKKALLKGASYGLKFPCSLYNTFHIDAIGECLTDLVTQYSIADYSVSVKVSCLAYIYLSRCIELYPRESHDSYRTRALLFKDHENQNVMKDIVMTNMGLSTIIDPFIIADFYFASKATDSPYRNEYFDAKRIHSNLEDITIAGKDADQYSLEEMAQLGEKRHHALFKNLEQKYMEKQFDIGLAELNSINR